MFRSRFARNMLLIAMFSGCVFLVGCPPTPSGPTAEFRAAVTSGAAPLTVQFTDLSTPGDSPITQWAWLFGDGGTSAEQDPAHTYAEEGKYNVSLAVTTDKGTDTKLKPNFVSVTAGSGGEGEGEPSQTTTVTLPGNVPLEMVWCPPGTFMMGSPDSEVGRNADEGPQHQVTLTHGFWMSKYEVTQAQWRAVTDNSPSYFQGERVAGVNTDSRPVEQVSWDDITGASGFLSRLNAANPGLAFRLPSEAEWEYACRAGTTTRFYWGDDLDSSQIGLYAWYSGNSGGQTHDVGKNLPNAWGLYDMSGNVDEWCQDWYEAYWAGAVSDPQGASSGSYRVLRGGNWYYDASYCRAANRSDDDSDGSDDRYSSFGFQLVRTP